jgi:iron(II)-dependent oxidoreductase
MTAKKEGLATAELLDAISEARERTLDLISDLSDEQLVGPRLPIVNPLRWEIGHVAYFYEYWILRHLHGHRPLMSTADGMYDSARIAHDARWDLPLPSRKETLCYMQDVLDRVLEAASAATPQPRGEADRFDQRYFLTLSLLHECMHAEAITYTRQTLGYPAPRLALAPPPDVSPERRSTAERALRGDTRVSGGEFRLGSARDSDFVFDNEQWEHPVEVKPFAIARTPVTNAEFAEFVEAGGYRRSEFWSPAGWHWRETTGAEHPVYWRRDGARIWLRREFDRIGILEPSHPVIHVNWYEADAWCRWAGRRLPDETEWEMAASGGEPSKALYPWGDVAPDPARANLDWRRMGCIDVSELPDGDSAAGCRQMIGNVWEWTATDFQPYPGFSPGPYKEYSAPWFGDHKVLRGGCWATRSILIRNAYRNFYRPDRRDVWAGFRTCSL